MKEYTWETKVLISIIAGVITFLLAGGCSSTTTPSADQLNGSDPNAPAIQVPKDKTLKLTIPDMKRVEDLPVYNAAPARYEKALHDGAVHVKGTGQPWRENANVYIAGHRLGFRGTKSWKVFDDLGTLEKGDKIFIEDTLGRKYTYEVYEKFIFGPDQVEMLEPTGEDIVTLQTCTLPDYKERLAVRARKV